MNNRPLDPLTLRHFVAVCEEGSIARAAARRRQSSAVQMSMEVNDGRFGSLVEALFSRALSRLGPMPVRPADDAVASTGGGGTL